MVNWTLFAKLEQKGVGAAERLEKIGKIGKNLHGGYRNWSDKKIQHTLHNFFPDTPLCYPENIDFSIQTFFF